MSDQQQPNSVIPPRQDTYTVPPFEDLTLMVFGRPGSGKTRFCGGDDKAIFAATEPGQEFIKSTVVPVREWPTFKKLVFELGHLKKDGKLPYSACVIDIVDNLNVMCRDSVCKAKGVTYPSDKDFGKTWAECNREWTQWLRVLMDIINVRFVTHCNMVDIEVPMDNGIKQEVSCHVPTFSNNKAAQYLDGIVNCVGYIHKKLDGAHVITFKQEPAIAAKDRTDILAQLGELPLDWATVRDAYAKKAEELGFKIRSKR